MFSSCSEIPLPVCCAERYKGIAFDGCRYYLTIRCECQIAVLDCNFGLVKQVETRRPYTAICYDPRHNCFWAVTGQCRPVIFKLDACFQEIDTLAVRLEGCCLGVVTGLSFCCESGLLVASSGNKLVEINPENAEVRPLWEDRRDALILSVACLSPYIMFCVLRDCKPYFVLSIRAGTLLVEEQRPVDQMIDGILLDPCKCELDACGVLFLTNKHGCYPYVFRVLLKEEICRNLCPCNRELCCVCKKPCTSCCESACADILESIALQEASIAHILNAEGEKLQKVIGESATTCELLQVNESVRRTIVHATHLEQVLFSKLDALRAICCCDPESPCCDK